MNSERFVGTCRQFAGWMIENIGELGGDTQRAAVGNRIRIDGVALSRRGIARERAERQMRDFLHRNRNWNFLGDK